MKRCWWVEMSHPRLGLVGSWPYRRRWQAWLWKVRADRERSGFDFRVVKR